MNAFSTLTLVKTKKILAVGLRDNFYELVYGNELGKDQVEPVFIDHSFKAYNWLDELSKEDNADALPAAILCDHQFLQNDDFLFIENIQKHPKLRFIPFISITDADVKVDAKACLKKGLDDCYTRPVEWTDLRKRLTFLSQHKAEILAEKDVVESYDYKIPTAKRVFDILFASAAIAVLSPVLLLIALWIKFGSKGPIIYKSKRIGTGYQQFDFLKFRSMVVDADAKLKDLAHLNTYDKGDSDGKKVSFVKLTNDPRITTIGKFIRKTSLDELPQLFNVLRGEMSIVGNRPLPLYEAEQMTRDEWAKRFLAPAGLTGLWQVNPKGKDNLTVEERIGLDIEYAETYSLWLDIKIISRTLPAMLQKEE